MDLLADLIGSLQVRIINVVIMKSGLPRNAAGVLDIALKFSVQRVENDLDPTQDPAGVQERRSGRIYI